MADPATDTTQDASPPIASLVGAPKGTLDDLINVQKKRAAADEAVIGREERQDDMDRMALQRAFNAEGHGPETLKPWDANKEHEKYESNPLEGFASPGALFAMVASAFTKAPMENAINGMAGALNGIKQSHEDSYNRAYDSWKENMKLAEQRHKMQHEAYTDALALADHDVNASNAKLRANAVRFGDQQTLMLLEHGMSKELYELIDARNKSMTQAVAASEAIQERGLKQEVMRNQWDALPKTGNPAVDAAHKLALFNRVYGPKQTAQQEILGQYLSEHPQATAEETAKFAQDSNIIPQRLKPAEQAGAQLLEQLKQEYRDQHEGQDPPANELAVMTSKAFPRGSGGTGMAAQESAAVDEEMKKNPGMSRTEAISKVKSAATQRKLNTLSAIDAAEVTRRQKAFVSEGMSEDEAFEKARADVQAARTGGKLPDETLKAIGAEKAAGDNSGMVGLSPYNRMKANQFAVETVKEKAVEKRDTIKKEHPDWDDETIDRAAKLTPEQLGETLSKQGASYQGLKAALRAVDVRSQAIRTAAVEAKKFMTIAQKASDEVPRTSSISFNKLVQMAESEVSDSKLKRFATANNTLVQQYARAISPTGVPTDQVRSHAYALLNTVDGPKAYKDVIDIMNQEMDAAIESPDAVRAMLLGESGDPTHAKPVESFGGNNVIKYDAQGNRVK